MSNLYVYLIRSRNKDNKDVPNFKERAETILGEDKYIANLYLTCNFFDRGELPYVTVNKDIIPDDFIEGR